MCDKRGGFDELESRGVLDVDDDPTPLLSPDLPERRQSEVGVALGCHSGYVCWGFGRRLDVCPLYKRERFATGPPGEAFKENQ